MSRMIYYAIYDIVDDSTRQSTIQILKDAGFTRIQKSVFCGIMNNQQKTDLLEKIKAVINEEEDSFYLIASCSQCFGKVITLGRDFDAEYVTGNRPSMVF